MEKLLWSMTETKLGFCQYAGYPPTFASKRYPTKAVAPMAAVPQNATRAIAKWTGDPPVRAATAPRSTKKTIENTYWNGSIAFNGARTATVTGSKAPAMNEPNDDAAA